MHPRSHFIILGGFLGAGKTTAVAKLARILGDQGLRVAVITNDQGADLVDTATLRAAGLPTAEISGGCFCCRFDALVAARGRLMTGEPLDVFIAEAVGSCTDLAATVVAPLRRLHGDSCTLAPLSVVVDAVLARRALGLGGASDFSDEVVYIYRKQIEEADIVIVNKAELLEATAIVELRNAISGLAPHATVQVVSLRQNSDLADWTQQLLFGQPVRRPTLLMDYDRYAGGEARLGWLNATIEVTAPNPFDPDQLLLNFAEEMRGELSRHHASVAHLKLTLQSTGADADGLTVVNLVRRDAVPEVSREFGRSVRSGTVLVNLRAEGAPDVLKRALDHACSRLVEFPPAVRANIDHFERFRPGRPQPTHRDVEGVAVVPASYP